VDLTGHYLNSILERKTVDLQEKTAELEALWVAKYEHIRPQTTRSRKMVVIR